MHDLLVWFNHLIVVWFDFVRDYHYLGIVVLMAMESSIFPVPSEVVIPPAAYWAAQGELSLTGVIIAGTVGSYLGSAITYWISLWLGRIVVVKWGRYFFISEEKLVRAEHFMHRYEAGGIFFARLLPVIRHLISIPAGLVKMGFGIFSLMTITGSLVWCSILAWFGHRIATKNPDLIKNPEQMIHAIKHESLPIVAFIAVLCVLYIVVMKVTAKRPTTSV